jgi:hypothetical protein
MADVDAAAEGVEASGGGIVKGSYDDAHERRAVVLRQQRQRLGLLQSSGPVKDCGHFAVA